MMINELKTRVIVINGTPGDRNLLNVIRHKMKTAAHHNYFGTHFTDNGSLKITAQVGTPYTITRASINSLRSSGGSYTCRLHNRWRFCSLCSFALLFHGYILMLRLMILLHFYGRQLSLSMAILDDQSWQCGMSLCRNWVLITGSYLIMNYDGVISKLLLQCDHNFVDLQIKYFSRVAEVM